MNRNKCHIKILQIISLFCWGLLSSTPATAQVRNTCDCRLLLDPDFKGKIGLYGSKGKLIKYLQHDFKEEDLITFEVKEDTDSLFNVVSIYEIANRRSAGWIKNLLL